VAAHTLGAALEALQDTRTDRPTTPAANIGAAAGNGKTVMAMQRPQHLARQGPRVLNLKFLLTDSKEPVTDQRLVEKPAAAWLATR